jgi:DNA-binding protein H-NS
MPKLSELIAQRDSLEKQIAEAQKTERTGAIAQIKALMSEHGLTAADLSGRAKKATGKPRSTAGSKVPVKYRDKAGNSWSGRGLQPNWLKAALSGGKKLQDFAV